MKKYEKLIVIVIGFKFVGIFLAAQLPRLLLPMGSTPLVPGQAMEHVFFIVRLGVSYVENGGIAYWLYQESRSALWAFFGFVFGIPALLLYYFREHFLKK